MEKVWSRRRLLAAAVAGTVAGCSDTSSEGTSDETRAPGTASPSRNPPAAGDTEQTPRDSAAVHHVSVDGADSNPGTEAEPLGSIQAGIDQAGPGETVYVHPGEYHENVRIRAGGEPDAPLTLTGPADAVLKPRRDNDFETVGVGASHVHITGLTLSGLHDTDEPETAQSYHRSHLVLLNTAPEEVGYIEDLVISPHRIGYAGGALINSKRIKDSDIGGFKVIGPAGAGWLFSERRGHYGEIVYLGTSPDNIAERGTFDEYDHTRNVRVHHIDNSEGHPHSELVDCKEGTRNITVEYCTDAGGVQSGDSYQSQAVNLGGRGCTVRWNVVRNATGSGVVIGPNLLLSSPETFAAEPETEKERAMGKDHAIYGNVFTGNSSDAIDLLRASAFPGRDSNPLPADQRVLCGNLFDGYSDASPDGSCPSGLPVGEGVGHLGGESPWSGPAPTADDVFSQHRTAPELDISVSAQDVVSEADIEATITVTNDDDSSKRLVFRLLTGNYELASKSVDIQAGERRGVDFTVDGLSGPTEVSITRDGQKIGRVRVFDNR